MEPFARRGQRSGHLIIRVTDWLLGRPLVRSQNLPGSDCKQSAGCRHGQPRERSLAARDCDRHVGKILLLSRYETVVTWFAMSRDLRGRLRP
jgi:hypothetical protein